MINLSPEFTPLVWTPPELLARFRAAAAAEERTVTECAVEALEAWLVYRQIGSRLAKTQDDLQEKPKNEYHTIPEIRAIISRHAESLRKELGEEFHLDVLRHHVKRFLTLKEGDKDIVGTRNMQRIDSQIANAIYAWPGESPLIIKTNKRQWYRFGRFGQSTLNLN